MKKLKEKLSAKLSKNGGFTLVEMLIVVAIIAILVAVSIPMVNKSLDKARRAVDEANARDSITLASVEVMVDGINEKTTWSYKVSDGRTGYLGTGSTTDHAPTDGVAGQCNDLTGVNLYVTYDPDATDGEYYSTSFDAKLYPSTP